MKIPYCLLCLLMLAGCGSGGNLDANTPVLADNRGTYRLAFTTVQVTAPGGQVSSFVSYSTGTLRLFENSTYARTIESPQGASISQGYYLLARSTSSILGSWQGSFSLNPNGIDTSSAAITGSYDVTPDFTLTLTYNQYALPDTSLVTRSNVWVKESDSPRF